MQGNQQNEWTIFFFKKMENVVKTLTTTMYVLTCLKTDNV